MPGMMYVPRQQGNQFQNQMMNLLIGLFMQRIAHKNRMEITDKQIKAGEALAKYKIEQEKIETRQEQQKEVRGYKAKGWREPEARKPVIEIGETGLVPPKRGFETRQVDVGGQTGLVSMETLTPYGGEKQVTKTSAIKTTAPQNKIGEIRTFESGDQKIAGIYTGNPEDNFGGMKGWAKTNLSAPRYKPETNVNVNVDMTKKTQGELEGEIRKSTESIAMADRLIGAAKPEYFEIPNQAQMHISKALERGGVAKWKTKKQSEYFTFWKMVRQESLKERKWFTGVAGGEKEMADIEATTPNMGDSYTAFISTLENRKALNEAARKRAMAWLDKGVNLRKLTPEQRAKLLEDDPLDNYGWHGALSGGKAEEQHGVIDRDVSQGKFVPGKLYEDAEGVQMRFTGYDQDGSLLWSEP
ncbi:MAG: hypothetical protein ACYTFW_00865 [Planctomycetota bacterium]|jgi:hypothetical protein